MKQTLALFCFFMLFAAAGQVFSEGTQPVSENPVESLTEKPPADAGENDADQVIVAQSDKCDVHDAVLNED